MHNGNFTDMATEWAAHYGNYDSCWPMTGFPYAFFIKSMTAINWLKKGQHVTMASNLSLVLAADQLKVIDIGETIDD